MWALGLLLAEVKLLIVGTEPGVVSASVIGLLSLMKPLQWVAPLIPMLPLKHLDFIESPVPIVAGLLLRRSSSRSSKSPGEFQSSAVETPRTPRTDEESLLRSPTTDDSRGNAHNNFSSVSANPSSVLPCPSCPTALVTDGGEDLCHLLDLDPVDLISRANCNDGMVVAVLDVNRRNIFLHGTDSAFLSQFLLPGASVLVDKLIDCTHSALSNGRRRGESISSKRNTNSVGGDVEADSDDDTDDYKYDVHNKHVNSDRSNNSDSKRKNIPRVDTKSVRKDNDGTRYCSKDQKPSFNISMLDIELSQARRVIVTEHLEVYIDKTPY